MNISSIRLSILLILSTVYFTQAHVVDHMALCREPVQQLALVVQDTVSSNQTRVLFPLHVVCSTISFAKGNKEYIPIVYIPHVLPDQTPSTKELTTANMLTINEEHIQDDVCHIFKLYEKSQTEDVLVCIAITGKQVVLTDAYLCNIEPIPTRTDVLQQMSMDELLDDLHEHGIFDNHEGPKDMNAVQGFFVQAAAYIFLGCLKLKTSISNILNGNKEKA